MKTCDHDYRHHEGPLEHRARVRKFFFFAAWPVWPRKERGSDWSKMATQRVIIAKIVGAGALEVLNRFRDSRRHPSISIGTRPCRKHVQGTLCRDAQAFVLSLRSHSHEPPVVFFAEYVDTWSMGDVFARAFGAKRTRRFLRVAAGPLEMIFYRLPDGGRLQRAIRLALRKTLARERAVQESHWLLTILLEALLSWQELTSHAVLVLVRDVIGPLVCDEEVEGALKDVPEWIVGRAKARKPNERASHSKSAGRRS